MRVWCRAIATAGMAFLLSASPRAMADEVHTVEPGETVATIATAHGVTPGIVITANGIPDVANLRVNQRLTIPGDGSVIVPGVTPYRQQRSLSCEYASVYIATMAFGKPVAEADSIAATPLDPNPHRGFRGNIDGEWGNTIDYGVYAEALVPHLAEHGFVGEVSYGAEAINLRAQIDAGRPTIVWLGYWGDTGEYETDTTGSTYKLVPGYHNVVAYSYDASGVFVANPGTGTLEYYPWDRFLEMWAALDGMTLAVYPA